MELYFDYLPWRLTDVSPYFRLLIDLSITEDSAYVFLDHLRLSIVKGLNLKKQQLLMTSIWLTSFIVLRNSHVNYCEYNYLGNAGANCRCHWDNAAIFVNVNKVWKSCWRSFWLDPCPLPFPPLSSRHSTFGRSKGTMSYNQFNKTV